MQGHQELASEQVNGDAELTENAREVPGDDRALEHLFALVEMAREGGDHRLVREDVLGRSAETADSFINRGAGQHEVKESTRRGECLPATRSPFLTLLSPLRAVWTTSPTTAWPGVTGKSMPTRRSPRRIWSLHARRKGNESRVAEREERRSSDARAVEPARTDLDDDLCVRRNPSLEHGNRSESVLRRATHPPA